MSNDEWKELSNKLHYGLALAEQRMLEKKAQRNEKVVLSTSDGKIKAVSARTLLRKARQQKNTKD
ncbi:MAG: hypothetical protein LUF01_10580 [Bacteroides sp.]|nr:hypothetical protein [Bacteroides sp.]